MAQAFTTALKCILRVSGMNKVKWFASPWMFPWINTTYLSTQRENKDRQIQSISGHTPNHLQFLDSYYLPILFATYTVFVFVAPFQCISFEESWTLCKSTGPSLPVLMCGCVLTKQWDSCNHQTLLCIDCKWTKPNACIYLSIFTLCLTNAPHCVRAVMHLCCWLLKLKQFLAMFPKIPQRIWIIPDNIPHSDQGDTRSRWHRWQ